MKRIPRLLLAAGTSVAALAVTAPAGATACSDGKVIQAQPGVPTYGTPCDDIIYGTAGADTIFGLGGDDLLYGAGGDDTLMGGQGDDVLVGGPGADILYGDRGNDVLYGETGNDWLIGGEGSDKHFGGPGNDRFRSNEVTPAYDEFRGEGGADVYFLKDTKAKGGNAQPRHDRVVTDQLDEVASMDFQVDIAV
ncbi:MAG: calcium-binding protein [Acidimicrobiia bacterium]